MLTEEQRQEIENILKEINRFRSEFPGVPDRFHSHTLYYKEKHKELDEIELYKDTIRLMREILFSPQLEYALYLDLKDTIFPSFECIEMYYDTFTSDAYSGVIAQFIPYMDKPLVSKKFIKDVIGVKYLAGNRDPLSQVLMYGLTFSNQLPQHVYVCPRAYIAEPSPFDFASIFNGKYGIIAYCMTLRDLLLVEISYGNKEATRGLSRSLECIRSLMLEKLEKCNILSELWYKDRKRACNIDLVKSIIHHEIEEANRLMQKYGIIRVTVPLD